MEKILALKFELEAKKNKNQAIILKRFFKTAPNQYGAGDIFWGIKVPALRIIAKKYKDLNLNEVFNLLKDPVHEVRFTAALILVGQYEATTNKGLHRKIYQFYCKNLDCFNNWDLIDLSAYKILGYYLYNYKSYQERLVILKDLALSNNMWRQRAAMVSTFYFIKKGRYQETFKIADILLNIKEDLLAKASGWMLREVGKRVSEKKLCLYLDKNALKMPAIARLYAIERLDKKTRSRYLLRKIDKKLQ